MNARSLWRAPRAVLAAALFLAVILAGGRFAFAAQREVADPRTIPLVDQSGATFHLRDLAGETTVVTFVSSRCTDACPIANEEFLQTYKRLQRDRLTARLLTITLDPDYDTPAVMARLARGFPATRDTWRFASGRPADVRALMQSLGVEAHKNARGIPEVHSSYVYVIDRKALLQTTLLLSTDLTNEVEAAVRRGRG